MMSDANFDAERLLSALSPQARRVLELGCSSGCLGDAFKERHAGVEWTAIDRSSAGITRGGAVLGAGYDTIVIGSLEHLPDPVSSLQAAHAAATDDARLVCCARNMSHVSTLERLLAGDCGRDYGAVLEGAPAKSLSLACTVKLLLDTGWLPNLRDYYGIAHPRQEFVQALVAAAAQIGIPAQTAARNILIDRMIIDCIKAPRVPSSQAAPFSVVVPVTNSTQLGLNVIPSPGLREVNAPVIEIRGATSAADAFAQGARQTATPWMVFAHQDVYFPAGSGHALAALFGSLPPAQADQELIGFAGIQSGPAGEALHAGLVIDRGSRFDHPVSGETLSMDEFAVAMSPRTEHRIDPALGWHLWGTDLCLSAARRRARTPRIVRVPLFHNSYNDGVLPPAFHQSARTLLAKYSDLTRIPTLCGTLTAGAA